MTIYFDLDGVLRLLGRNGFIHEPNDWYEKINGKTVIEIVNDNPEICELSPPSEYLNIVNNSFKHIIILTNQLPDWIPYTERWLQNHMKIPYDVVYTKNGADKLTYLNEFDYLVEDYPGFDSYDRIALITRNYNKHIEAPIRISTENEFEQFLGSYTMFERFVNTFCRHRL